ncbi:MAG: type II secretion system secretin GspD [Planctomycetes bacterium]|nr:type II secretion system secretin GspD [Planctomycetota bacterium]
MLDLLAQEAGYIIVNPVDLPGPITLVSRRPLGPAEAVEALNSVLLDQGHTAIVRGRTLRVVPLASARQQNLPVGMGADPERIPDSDRMVTQVIPVQFATVKDLADNLQPLLNNATATLTANESSNSLLLTDTQANIRRIAAIVQAIDGSVLGVQQVKVFHLVHADAEKVAKVVNDVYGQRQAAASSNRGGAFMPGFFPGAMQQMQGGARGGAQGGAGSGQSRGGEVVAAADSGSNSVVVRASPGALTALAAVIEQMDVDTSGRDGVLLYRVRNAKAADLAKSLTSLFQNAQTTATASNAQRSQNRQQATPAPVAAAASDSALDLTGQVRVVADEVANTVLVLSPERNFPLIRRILDDMDHPMRQVLVRVVVAELTVEEGLDLGVQMEVGDVSTATTASRAFSDFNIFDKTLGVNGYLINSTQFRAAMRALATDTRFNVLSRPYVLTTDNRQAVVNVSQEVPVINGARTDAQNNITTTFDRRDVGVILTVTPQINSDGRVVLDVTQELSALADQGIPVAKDVESPIIRKRTMTTRVGVGSGQTVVVGGLVNDTLVETVRKVPWLGDIPYLGALFRRTISTRSKTELLVFLTPQVVQDGAEADMAGRVLRSEMQELDAAMEPRVLGRQLDLLERTAIGQPLAPPATAAAASPTAQEQH